MINEVVLRLRSRRVNREEQLLRDARTLLEAKGGLAAEQRSDDFYPLKLSFDGYSIDLPLNSLKAHIVSAIDSELSRISDALENLSSQ